MFSGGGVKQKNASFLLIVFMYLLMVYLLPNVSFLMYYYHFQFCNTVLFFNIHIFWIIHVSSAYISAIIRHFENTFKHDIFLRK